MGISTEIEDGEKEVKEAFKLLCRFYISCRSDTLA